VKWVLPVVNGIFCVLSCRFEVWKQRYEHQAI